MVPGLALMLLAAAVEVVGTSGCPDPVVVAAGLAAILPAEGGGQPDRARLSPTSDGRAVHVELRRADGVVMGTRVVAIGATCAATAEIVAVVIASLEARFRSGLEGALDLDLSPPPPARRRRIDVGAAAMISRQSGDSSPGVMAELAVGVGSGRLALRAAPLLVWGHEGEVPPGTASWSRAGLALGLRFRLAKDHLWGDAVVDALGTALFSRGRGFVSERTAWSFDPGAATWLRCGLTVRRLEPWLGAALIVWPRTQRMQVQGLPDQAFELSHWELFFAAGLSFRYGE